MSNKSKWIKVNNITGTMKKDLEETNIKEGMHVIIRSYSNYDNSTFEDDDCIISIEVPELMNEFNPTGHDTALIKKSDVLFDNNFIKNGGDLTNVPILEDDFGNI